MINSIPARRIFNQGFFALHSWFMEQETVAPSVLWEQFNAHLGAEFGAQNASVWHCALHPSWRVPLANLFCEIAHAKMRLDPWGDPTLDESESRLWSAALSSSPRAVRDWEKRIVERDGELGHGFESVRHRLADNCRRAGRHDLGALRLYIEAFTGRHALPISRRGAGAHHAVGALLERGVAISAQTAFGEIPARYSLCLLLWNRGWNAVWVGRSLEIARVQLPSTRERLDGTLGRFDARRLRIAQQPAIATLAATLVSLAQQREWEAIQAEIEAQARAEAEAKARIERESASPKPKRKRGRPRKKAPEIVAPAPISQEGDVDWESIDFNALFREEPPASNEVTNKIAPSAELEPIAITDWDEFDFNFEENHNG